LCDQKVSKIQGPHVQDSNKTGVFIQAETWTDYLAGRVSKFMLNLRYCLEVTLEEHNTNACIRQEVKVINVLELMV